MTRKSCAVGMRNAILRNYLKCIYIYIGHALSYISSQTLSLASLQGDVAALVRSHMNGLQPLESTIEHTTETMPLATKQ